jgi:hypothetical protein
MKTLIISLSLVSLLIGGCATTQPAVPEGYKGPVAIVKDSVKIYSASKADVFFLQEVDGRRIDNSRARTEQLNQGAGLRMRPAVVERNIPAQVTELKIVARTIYAAPILALTKDVFQIVGTVKLAPQPYKTYVVRGELGENYSAVWLEDEATGQPVDAKIESHGSTKLGVMEK